MIMKNTTTRNDAGKGEDEDKHRDDDDEKEFTREDGNAEGSELLFKLVRDILTFE